MRFAAHLALLSLLWISPALGWAANVRGVSVPVANGGIPTVPGALSAPSLNLRIDQPLGLLLPSGSLLAAPAAPSVELPQALPVSMPEEAVLQTRVSDRKEQDLDPGRNALERLSAEIPFVEPEAADFQGQKDFADRSFDFKLGLEEAGRGSVVAEPSQPEAAGQASAQEPSPQSDDGGGAAYPRRKVRFNNHEFDSVALRPNVPVEEKIVEAIKASRKTIRLALYEFKSRAVMEALQRARRRGVKIEIILDYSNVFPKNEADSTYRARRSNEIWGLIRDGFDFRVLRGATAYGINHNKFAVFDGRLAEFGSYNWSFTAENSHYENALFTTERSRVWALKQYWDYLRNLSVPYPKAKEFDWPETVPKPPTGAMGTVDFNGADLPAVLFTPDGAAFEDAVARALDASRKTADVAMFALRSRRIADALARAVSRGVRVRMVMDESQSESEYFGPFAAWLASSGVQVKTLAGPNPESDFPMAEKTHHKFMVLDGKLVETGSANWTKRASMDNYENAHFLDDKTDAAAFTFAFEHMFSIAKVFPKPDAPPDLPTDAELLHDILNPAPPKPTPPPPDLPPLPAAPILTFNGAEFPAYALLPDVPIAPLIVKAINAAKKTVRLAVYEFTSESILEALRRAKARGVEVEIVLDRNHLYTSGINHEGEPRKPKPQVVALAKEGFDMKLLRGKNGGVMHNKYLVVDDELAAFGSYNLTDVAEAYHFENFVFTMETGRVAAYLRYFAYKRGLAEDIDFAKLDEILNRTVDTMAAEESEPAETPRTRLRTPDLPPPPEDAEEPIVFNGESFRRQLFSPKGRIEEALIRAIKAAKVSIEIAMFSFYSQAIADALLEVRQNRPEVAIRIVMDYSQSKLSRLDDWFSYYGFDMRLIQGPHGDDGDPMFEKMHNKFMVADGKLLETGSFNFSPNAENNSFENANFIDDPAHLAGFAAYFQRLWLQSWKPAPPRRRPPSRILAARAPPESPSDSGRYPAVDFSAPASGR